MQLMSLVHRIIGFVIGIAAFLYTAWHSRSYPSSCYAMDGYFWPMYKQVENGKPVFYRGVIHSGANAKYNVPIISDKYIKENIFNVSDAIKNQVIVYIAINILLVISYGIRYFFKAKKGILYHIVKFSKVMPAILLIQLFFLIYRRYVFSSQVCLCDFK